MRIAAGHKADDHEQELDTFLQAVQKDDTWRDFFYTELMTGLRRDEICALMWRDFDAKTGTLRISRTLHSKGQDVYALGDTKTSKGNRTIILPESVAALLRARKNISGQKQEPQAAKNGLLVRSFCFGQLHPHGALCQSLYARFLQSL